MKNNNIQAIIKELEYGNIIDKRDRNRIIIDTWNTYAEQYAPAHIIYEMQDINYYLEVYQPEKNHYIEWHNYFTITDTGDIYSFNFWADPDSPININKLAEYIASGKDWALWRNSVKDVYDAVMRPEKWAAYQLDILDAKEDYYYQIAIREE